MTDYIRIEVNGKDCFVDQQGCYLITDDSGFDWYYSGDFMGWVYIPLPVDEVGQEPDLDELDENGQHFIGNSMDAINWLIENDYIINGYNLK